MLSGLRHQATFRVSGEPTATGLFEKSNDGEASLSVTGEELFVAVDERRKSEEEGQLTTLELLQSRDRNADHRGRTQVLHDHRPGPPSGFGGCFREGFWNRALQSCGGVWHHSPRSQAARSGRHRSSSAMSKCTRSRTTNLPSDRLISRGTPFIRIRSVWHT